MSNVVIDQNVLVIDSFRGEYRFLSNFWPCSVWLDDEEYLTVENAYQAAKTQDEDLRFKIQRCSPGEAKKLGQKATLPPNWEGIKLDIMVSLLFQKFADKGLRRKLLSTGSAELVEGNTWGDFFWGVCDGKGQNRLGRLLMGFRSIYQVIERVES